MKMTKLPDLIAVAIMTLFILAAAPGAWATNYLWDGAATQTPATGSDGNGIWDTSSTKWGNTTDMAWPSSPATTDAAYIGQSANTAAYTITVNQSPSGVTVNNISFRDMANYGNYTIAGTAGSSGTINMNPADFFTIQTGAGGTNTVSAPIVGTLNSGKAFIINRPVNTSGKLILSGANTFTPGTTPGVVLRQGTVFVSSLNTVGSVTNNNSGNTANQASSCLGAAVSGKSGISIGYNGYAATLIYTGSGEGTDRPFTICSGTPATGSAGTIQNDGTGPLVLAGNITSQNAGTLTPRPFTLRGANTGLNEVKGTISDASATLLVSLTKADAGTWFLSGANTYSGGTTISGGTLKINSDTSLGTAPGSATAGNLVINNATLYFAGSNPSTITLNANRGIALGATSGQQSGFIQMDTGVTVNYAGIMANNPGGTGNLYLPNNSGQGSAGTLVLSGPSTFTGNVLNRASVLSVGSINTVNTVVNTALSGGQSTHQASSNLGAPTSASTGSIQLGYNSYNGTLLFTGSGEGTDRNINIGNTPTSATGGGGAVIQNDGSGPLVFTGTFTFGGANAGANNNKTLTLQGNNNSANQIISAISDGAVNGSFTAITSLLKSGNGTWILSGANTYSGGTTISGGTMKLGAAGALPSGSAVTLGAATLDCQTYANSGGTLDVTNAGTINLGSSGGTLAFVNSSSKSWTGGSLNITGTFVSGSSIRFGTDGSGLTTAQKNAISINGSGAGTYTLNSSGYLEPKTTPTLSVANSPVTYNGSQQAVTVNGSVAGTVSNVKYNNSSTVPTVAGTYATTADFTPTDVVNYNSLSGASAGNFIINPKAASVTADAKIKTYGNVNPPLTAVTNGAVSGDVINVTIATTATQYSAVGVSNITVTAGSNPNYTVLTINSTLTINPASTFVGASSTHNPSGYKDSVAFLATLPADATGSVVFSSTNAPISTNTVSGVTTTSLSITNLPRGTNVINVAYLGDGNYVGSTNTLDQIVTNHPPVATDANYYRAKGLSLKIAITNLLTYLTDVDGDTSTLQSVGAGLTNATIMTDSTYVYYLPATGGGSNDNDVVSYTVSDGFGGSATANILVDVYSAAGPAQMSIPTNGVVNITFHGIPNYTYIVQTTTNLSVPWWTLSTNTASTNGSWQFTDPNATNAQQYYRSSQP